jgi:hypothetical protein
MSHVIAAFVAKSPAAAALSRALGDAPAFRINHAEFLLVPVSDDAFDALVEARGPSEPVGDDFWRLTAGLIELGRECSVHGPVAYIETDYFGGAGIQGAAAWIAGKPVLAATIDEIGPINVALRAIGLSPTTATTSSTRWA